MTEGNGSCRRKPLNQNGIFLTTEHTDDTEPEHGNRRTDEQGVVNFEVPEQYFFTTNLRE